MKRQGIVRIECLVVAAGMGHFYPDAGKPCRLLLFDLPDDYRAVMLLHDVEGLTNPEIAEMLDITLATAKIRLHRARVKLRDALNDACSFSTDERGVVVCEPKPVKIKL